MLFQCWSSVADGGPKLNQHWFNVLCLLGDKHWFSVSSQQTRDSHPKLIQSWASVADNGPTFSRHWVTGACRTVLWSDMYRAQQAYGNYMYHIRVEMCSIQRIRP